MEWSRAKTLLIVILLCVNIFLMATYISKENEARNDEAMLKADIVRILSGRGISVEPETIPSDSIVLTSATVKKENDGRAAAEQLFGEVTESVDDKNITYSSENGNIMFSGDSFSLVYESGREVDGLEAAKSLASSIARKLSIATSKAEFSAKEAGESYIVKVPQLHSGLRVFDCFVEFKIFPNGSVMAHGKFIGRGNVQRLRGDMKKTSALLLDFVDEMAQRQESFVAIRKISLGYFSISRSSEITILMPAIEIETDAGAYCLAMESGKIIS